MIRQCSCGRPFSICGTEWNTGFQVHPHCFGPSGAFDLPLRYPLSVAPGRLFLPRAIPLNLIFLSLLPACASRASVIPLRLFYSSQPPMFLIPHFVTTGEIFLTAR